METNKIQQNTEKTDVSKAPEGAKKEGPVKEYRAGGIVVTVWQNQTEDNNTYYTTTIKRTFTLDDGKTFKECNHFGLNDLPRLILLTGEAYRYILLNKE